MATSNNEQTTEDVLIAAIEAQCRQWERDTGTPREVMWNKLPDELRPAVEEAQALFADRMAHADRPGWAPVDQDDDADGM